jgi:DNA-binding transcriptional regulator YiaG
MANHVTRARQQAGLTQQESADILHVDIRTFQRWEEAASADWAKWELYLLLTDQHPQWMLKKRKVKPS